MFNSNSLCSGYKTIMFHPWTLPVSGGQTQGGQPMGEKLLGILRSRFAEMRFPTFPPSPPCCAATASELCGITYIISCLREFRLFSQVYSQLIYLIKFIFTNRTSIHVKPGLFRTNQTWFDVNGGTISKNEFNEVY